ncbi:hypothetical protein DSO57_1010730 [Entomophthora muscae]|uniref:Uncharacterized protein n=1 Tax=Entomophthora muscae TaxID=34485 RepID=A0ACC2SVM1_9FUNG|nr:hypothetical protein DSO57_1010730 [Entomophthora muscae]
MQAAGLAACRNKNTSKQPKDNKCHSKSPKTPKQNPASTKKASPKPFPKLTPEQIPAHITGDKESDGSLTKKATITLHQTRIPTRSGT